jgi:TetR/AcrR family fatty acid metabolism transcriptional regulator
VGKKEAIRKAAVKIMAKEGFYNTKMQAIADECGIAIGTLYLYFKRKEDILDYIFMVEYKKRLAFAEYLKKSDLSGLEQISSFLIYHLFYLIKHPDTTKVLIQEVYNPSLNSLEWVSKSYKGIVDIFKNMLDFAKQNGEIRDIDTEIIGASIFLSSRALTYKLQKEGRDNDYEYAFEQFISFIINGLKK